MTLIEKHKRQLASKTKEELIALRNSLAPSEDEYNRRIVEDQNLIMRAWDDFMSGSEDLSRATQVQVAVHSRANEIALMDAVLELIDEKDWSEA